MVLDAGLARPPAIVEAESIRRRDAAHGPYQLLDESPVMLLPHAGVRAARRGVEAVGRDDLVGGEAKISAELLG